ncbi:MAG: hypothetical protein PHE55_18225 [Methylococcaceae bacterium]|nr:hypothetical protein [Methylococcaceae bacterium]
MPKTNPFEELLSRQKTLKERAAKLDAAIADWTARCENLQANAPTSAPDESTELALLRSRAAIGEVSQDALAEATKAENKRFKALQDAQQTYDKSLAEITTTLRSLELDKQSMSSSILEGERVLREAFIDNLLTEAEASYNRYKTSIVSIETEFVTLNAIHEFLVNSGRDGIVDYSLQESKLPDFSVPPCSRMEDYLGGGFN